MARTPHLDAPARALRGHAADRHGSHETANTGRIRIRDAYGVEEWLEPFDTTAISVGYRPEKMLARELEHMRLPYKAIGDCVVPGKILDAMHQGLAAAYAL